MIFVLDGNTRFVKLNLLQEILKLCLLSTTYLMYLSFYPVKLRDLYEIQSIVLRYLTFRSLLIGLLDNYMVDDIIWI